MTQVGRWGPLLAAICCGVLLASATAASALPPVKHVFVIVDENESASTTFAPGSPAPYLSKTLVSQGAFVPNYYGIGHSSLDNYIAMVSGQAPNPLTSGDCPAFTDFPTASLNASGQENGLGCVYPADVPSLMSQLDHAGASWRAYEDGMGTNPARESATCGHPTVGSADSTQGGESAPPYDEYATRHDPFVYFHYVIDNAAECNAKVVNLGQLPTDLQSESATPNYVFITPNLCDDGHDSPCHNPTQPGGLTQADQFLQTWVPRITSSPAYKHNGLLIIVFDEAVGDASACCGEQPGPAEPLPGGSGPGGGVVGAVMLSRYITPGTRSSSPYNHYSMLGTVEDLFGLSRIGYAAGAPAFGSDVFTNPSGTFPGSLSLGHLRASKSKLTVPLNCAGGPFSICEVALTLTAKHKGTKLAHASVTIPAGQQRTLHMALNPAGKRLLAGVRVLKVKLTVTEAGKPVFVKSASFRRRG